MYAKVFTQIYDGTLCTRGPWQALVTFQQLLVLADRDGNVDMTAAAVSRRTTIPLDIIELGIVELLKPDPESRTPTEEGRRIVPLAEGRSWGWRIVNYAHYRELKREEDRRQYHRDYWHKRKLKAESATQQDSTNSTKSTEAYAEAEAYTGPASSLRSDAPPRASRSLDDVPAGFAEFWTVWPKSSRKGGKAECLKVWKSRKLEPLKTEIVAHVKAMASSHDWTKNGGEYIPAPVVYLRAAKWDGAEIGGTGGGLQQMLVGAV